MAHQTDAYDDPQWELTLEIASKLWFYGEHTIVLHPRPHQRLVNIQWAALQAGRLFDVRAKASVSAPFSKTDPRVAVKITFTDPTGQAMERAQERFDHLLRSVRERYPR